MKTEKFPSISVVIPTLNCRLALEKCLKSISIQNYPKDKIEVIIADGGSKDSTINTAKKYKAMVINNPLKTGEAGKAIGVKAARGELIALIDSDNILPNNHWLSDMVAPFKDQEITVSEPIKYTYRKRDPYLTRYFALLGMNDPICLFIGNYDRYSYLTNRWTNLKFKEDDKGSFLKVTLDHEPIPTIGANGTIFRREVLKSAIKNTSYLFDIDVLLKLIRSKGIIKIAKVKTGIVHTFVEADMGKFFRKQLRRINDMSFHKSKNNREISWEGSFMSGILRFMIECLLVFPILIQTLTGFIRKPDVAWLFHPIACYATLYIYLYGWLKGKVLPQESSRKNWKQ